MDSARDRIVAAALELFSSRGYRAASTREIAKAAGVNEVTIFRIFGNKAALFEAVHGEHFVKPAVVLGEVPTTGSLEADLVALAIAYVGLFQRNHKLVAMSIKDIKAEFAGIDAELRDQVPSLARIAESRMASAMDAAARPSFRPEAQRSDSPGGAAGTRAASPAGDSGNVDPAGTRAASPAGDSGSLDHAGLARMFAGCVGGLALHRALSGSLDSLAAEAEEAAAMLAAGIAARTEGHR